MSALTRPCIFIGVAGGSGAGKSTLCMRLQENYPELLGLLQLDDYFKPDALYFDKLQDDLAALRQGRAITQKTKNPHLNPDYPQTQQRILAVFEPKPVYLLEGYLILHDPEIRKHLTTSLWLDVDHETRWERRVHFKLDDYEKNVLIPMHATFVEPSKAYAKHYVDVAGKNRDEVYDLCLPLIKPYLEQT
jgi:uridine kinase